jgi:3-oxoacyl-[acyl-carrier-protein] synthase-1
MLLALAWISNNMTVNNIDSNSMYIADLEICTPLSNDVAELAEKIQANDNEFCLSDYYGHLGQQINMSLCDTDSIHKSFNKPDPAININRCHRDKTLVQMAEFSLAPLLSRFKKYSPTLAPFILALAEQVPAHKPLPPNVLAESIKQHLGEHADMIHWNQFMPVTIGRAGVLATLSLAQKLFHQNNGIELIIIGGLDSYRHSAVLRDLSKQQRIAMTGCNGFVTGEGAGFLVLTNNKKYALKANKGYVRIHPPGLAVEQGYLGSHEPNLGQGLTSAIKTALDSSPELEINHIYSSMNGEAIWYEEHVASTLRHRHQLGKNIAEKTTSSAYNIGDIGSASGVVSIALSAHKLFSDAKPQRHLITTSSDKNQRSAVCLTFELAENEQDDR